MAEILIKGILSYPNLQKARLQNKEELDPAKHVRKYSAAILIPKSDKVTIAKIETAIKALKAEHWPKGFPPTGKLVYREAYDEDRPELAAGYMQINASADESRRPSVYGTDKKLITDWDTVYAGKVCYFMVNPYAYKRKDSSGITFGLNGVIVTAKLGDLGRLDGRASIDSVFADLEIPEDELLGNEAEEDTEGEGVEDDSDNEFAAT